MVGRMKEAYVERQQPYCILGGGKRGCESFMLVDISAERKELE
jgi:hypothetical protein